ncbi:MAG TPA: hypothetical protein VHA12_02090 [Candidatus Nanoarchaeia archaeon]|nr:hypothetical protein [Candidatus Nanoarchaeia archaeon]
MNSKNFPMIDSQGEAFLEEVVLWTDLNIERKKWSNRDIERKLGRRTAQEVINSGNTCYMNPCLDLTLVAAATAQINGIPHTLVIEEHGPTDKFPENRLHFALEISEGKEIFLNYKSGNNVQIGSGKYPGRSDIPRIQMVHLDGRDIDYSLPLHRSLHHSSLNEALKKMFKGYNLAQQLHRLTKDNTERNYQAYLKKSGLTFKIEYLL